jgi:hypothetical protein
MTELDTVVGKHLADQQSAVALVWLGLAAHQSDPVALATALQALYRPQKRRLFSHAVITGSSLLVVVILPRGPAAQLLSKE